MIQPVSATAPRLRIDVLPGGNVAFIDVDLGGRSFTLDIETARTLANGIYEKLQLARDCVTSAPAAPLPVEGASELDG